MPKLKLLIPATLMLITTYVLCLFYSSLSIIYLLVKYIQNDPKFWIPKLRKEPPACLSNPEFGTHKYIQLNVSNLSFDIQHFT